MSHFVRFVMMLVATVGSSELDIAGDFGLTNFLHVPSFVVCSFRPDNGVASDNPVYVQINK